MAEGKKPKFNDGFWKNYKDDLFKVQFKKCGYCETIISGDYGDVEHYRPKSEVNGLSDNPEDWGKPAENLNNVKGRKFLDLCKPGYWWLAYTWENYLLSCAICNQAYKSALFPIKETREKLDPPNDKFPFKPPGPDDDETPLLMNPFDQDIKPVEHLEYTAEGLVKPANDSEFGFETIRTVGLDRDSLNHSRLEKASRVHMNVKMMMMTNDENMKKLLAKQIVFEGGEEFVHAGMVRIIYEQAAEGNKWEELEEMVLAEV